MDWAAQIKLRSYTVSRLQGREISAQRPYKINDVSNLFFIDRNRLTKKTEDCILQLDRDNVHVFYFLNTVGILNGYGHSTTFIKGQQSDMKTKTGG